MRAVAPRVSTRLLHAITGYGGYWKVKRTLAASAALAAMITGQGGTVAQASARVPCDPAALTAAMTTASAGGTLSLAAGCDYVLTAGRGT
jgi:hypothetical protein